MRDSAIQARAGVSGWPQRLGKIMLGLAGVAVLGALTFVVHRRLPYKKMLVLTGVLLGVVLVVMVGESAQEMQLAHWTPTTAVNLPLPEWLGTWFAVFPTAQALAAQALAATTVLGSFFYVRYIRLWRLRRQGPEATPLVEATPTLESAP